MHVIYVECGYDWMGGYTYIIEYLGQVSKSKDTNLPSIDFLCMYSHHHEISMIIFSCMLFMY